MNKSNKTNPKNMNNPSENLAKTIKENENFLLSKARKTYDEVVGLSNDSAYVLNILKEARSREHLLIPRWWIALYLYALTILNPFGNAILADLLTSNLIGCFMELRLLLESLVKSHYADTNNTEPEHLHLYDKISNLNKKMYTHKISISDLMEKCGRDAKDLWKALSNEWLHTEGLAKKKSEELTKKWSHRQEI